MWARARVRVCGCVWVCVCVCWPVQLLVHTYPIHKTRHLAEGMEAGR
jgi:hypothetical protein